jgi:DNA-binding LacI/PurR family transcriptional regulator
MDSNQVPQENHDVLRGSREAGKRVTVYDIARKVGVSHTTVARALGNRKEVSKGRREEIQRVAAEMGYVPDPHLAALANYRKNLGPNKFQSVVVWINHWQQPAQLRHFGEFERYWQGASETAAKHGFKLEDFRWPLGCTPERLESMLVARGVEGVLIPPHHEAPDWGDFDWSKFSVLRFGMSVPAPDSNLVTTDQFRATGMAVTQIHEHGYRRIGLAVDFDLDEHLGGNYNGGFVWAQKKLRLCPQIPAFAASAALFRSNPAAEAENLQRWLARHRPEAILTSQPYLPQMLRDLGYRIPEDIAVAGTSVCDMPVDAGIDQCSVEIGRIAMQMLIKQISVGEKGPASNPSRILVESRWQDGASLPRRS